MFWALLFIGELIGLFFLSQELTKSLSSFLLKFTKNYKTTIYIMAILFFPGVFVHEFSHLILANAMFVRTGEVEFFPQMEGDHVKLGSVAVAKSDPFRRFLIGVAPIILGLTLMFGLFFYLSPFFPGYNWQTLVLTYLFFEIGNTMFSSKKDMEGSLFLLVAIGILAAALYLTGFRLSINFASIASNEVLLSFFKRIDILSLIPICIDAIVIVFMKTSFKKLHA